MPSVDSCRKFQIKCVSIGSFFDVPSSLCRSWQLAAIQYLDKHSVRFKMILKYWATNGLYLFSSVNSNISTILKNKSMFQKYLSYIRSSTLNLLQSFDYELALIYLFFKKMGQPRPLFRLFSVFSNKHYNFYNKYM